jgi:AraC family transcriptional regulator
VVETHASITLGRRAGTVELGGLRLVETVHAPGTRLAPHAHGSANVTLVLEGGFRERTRGASVRARPTSLVLKPRGTVHADCYGERPTRAFVIEVAPEREAELGLDRLGAERWFHGGSPVAEVLEVLRAARARQDDLERTVLEALRALLARAGEEPQALPPRAPRAALALRAAERLLSAAPARAPGSAELARRVGLHPVYLARLFRVAHGRGPAAFRRGLQVQEAARLLAETDAPAGQVALAAGFADQSHLCRAFKAELGVSPVDFRRLVRPAAVDGGDEHGSHPFKTPGSNQARLGA